MTTETPTIAVGEVAYAAGVPIDVAARELSAAGKLGIHWNGRLHAVTPADAAEYVRAKIADHLAYEARQQGFRDWHAAWAADLNAAVAAAREKERLRAEARWPLARAYSGPDGESGRPVLGDGERAARIAEAVRLAGHDAEIAFRKKHPELSQSQWERRYGA